MPGVTLDAGDAAELAEMPTLIGEWLARDNRLKTSIAGQIGHPAYGIQQLRDDLDRILSESLIEDLRVNAPQVRVAVVMPGHVDTDIVANSFRARGLPTPEQMSDAQVEELIPRDAQAEGASAADLRRMLVQANADFRDKAPVSAAEAAAIILDGVLSGGAGGPRRRGRQEARHAGTSEARGRLRLRRAVQRAGRRAAGGNALGGSSQRPAGEGRGRASLIPAGRTALSQTRVMARDVHWRGAPARRMIVRRYHL